MAQNEKMGSFPQRRIFYSFNSEKLILYSVSFLVCLLIIYPIAIIIVDSFKIEAWGKEAIYTLNNYLSSFGDSRFVQAVMNTLLVSLGATGFATILGCALAWLIARTNMPLRGFFEIINTIPLFLSPFVGAIAWMHLAAPRAGFLNKITFKLWEVEFLNIYGIWGVIWVLGLFFTPVVYLILVGSLKTMDPSLEDAALACGASLFRTTFAVTLPLVSPAILSALMLVFVSSAGEFGVPLTLGSPHKVDTLVTIIFEVLHRPRPDYNLAAAMGSVLLILTIVLTLVYRKTVAGKAYITVTGKDYRPGLINLGKWKYAGFALNILYAVMAIFLPIFILLVISTHRVWVGSIKWDKLSLRNFYELIFVDQYAMGGFGNSIFLGIIGATTAMLACVIVSYFIYRSRYQGRATVEYLTNLPVGLPGIVLAMGFLLAFIKTPLYATIWILMIAYVIRFIPYGLRSVSSVLLSLSPELDESSRACGSSWLRTLKNITFPLLKPGFVAGWLLLFIIFFRELPISMLLWSSGNHVMSVVLWQLLEHRTAGLTSAYAIMQIMVIFIVIFVMHKTTGTKDVKV